MSYRCLDLRRDGAVLHVTLNNPPVNLLDAALTRELNALAKTLAGDAALKLVVFASADPDFYLCHSDERELLALPPPEPRPADAPRAEPGPFHRIMERLRVLPQLTIGQVDGIARGGGLEFLLALDLRFASARSRFALPEVSVGLIPGGGGTQRLPLRIGRSRALLMMAGAEDIDATTAERWGLVDRLCDTESLAGDVEAWTRRVASFPGAALRALKSAAQAAGSAAAPDLAAEEAAFRSLLQDPRVRERAAAFHALGSQDRTQQRDHWDAMIRALPTAD